jgi:16S rRNA (cytosine967-C5)-methyltransferase
LSAVAAAGLLPPGLATRQSAAQRLQDVLAGARFVPLGPFDIVDPRDRALANRLVTTALRRHGHLNLALAQLLERGLPPRSGSFEAVLRLALTQLLYLPEIGDHSALFLAVEAVKRDRRAGHLAKLMNAVLRRAQSEASNLRQLPMAALFPEAVQRNWAAAYGAEAIEGFGEGLLAGGPLDLTLKLDNAALRGELGEVRLLDDVVRLDHRDRPIDQLPGYAEGEWWVQDVAASLPARLITLAPGARVLDLCAAPGGKTAQLLKAGYDVTALDSDRERLDRLELNLRRLNYQGKVVCADALAFRPAALFDGVLLDAPCSATGTFRRHPEVIWHRIETDIAGRVALQRRFLRAAVEGLAPGGTLIYCVCSLEPQEGEAQVAWALANLGELSLSKIAPAELGPLAAAVTADGFLRTYPGMALPAPFEGGLDGFFAARFQRR